MLRLPRSRSVRSAGVTTGLVLVTSLGVAPLAAGSHTTERAAPPPVTIDASDAAPGRSRFKITVPQQYDQGDPTGAEQEFMELMNRARTDPAGEAERILDDYGDARITQSVDFFLNDAPGVEWTRQENHDAFAAYPVQPPFAFNPKLIAAARGWTQVMILKNEQEHEFDGLPTLGQRITNEGYTYFSAAESIFAFADDVLHAHAGLAIDWGQPIDQDTGRPMLGHRNNLMNYDDTDVKDYREIGVGVTNVNRTRRGDVGPTVCTIDFASQADPDLRFVTGVCWNDVNANGRYDAGEGVQGVEITVSGTSFFAVTSASGGYAVPVQRTAGALTVTARPTADPASNAIGIQTAGVSTYDFDVAGGNTKADFEAPPAPEFAYFDSPGGVLSDGSTFRADFLVPRITLNNATVGDVIVDVDITHADRRELRVTLTSPDATEVVLFDGESPGHDLTGTFGRSLRTTSSLAAFEGERHEGMWTLRVSDAAGGVAGGVLGCRLGVRPGWYRPLLATHSALSITKLKIKDSPKPGKDSIVLKADVDVGAQFPLDAAQQVHLVLRPAGSPLGELVHVDLSQSPFAKTGRRFAGKAATLAGGIVSLSLDPGRGGTSRAVLSAKVKGVDLPLLEDTMIVELDLGDTRGSQTVAFTQRAYSGRTPPRDPFFHVDQLTSKVSKGLRTTVVKGRFNADNGTTLFQGDVEFAVGDFAETVSAADFAEAGTRRIFKGAKLKKLLLDPAKGTFVAKVVAEHTITPGEDTTVRLRVDAYHGEQVLVPAAKGAGARY